MLRANLRALTGTVVVLFAFLVASATYAQDVSAKSQDPSFSKNAETWTNQLSEKVNLAADQQTKIQALLVDYQKAMVNADQSTASALMTTYNSKIESVLNDNQQKLYKNYQADWWKGISRPSGSSEKSGY